MSDDEPRRAYAPRPMHPAGTAPVVRAAAARAVATTHAAGERLELGRALNRAGGLWFRALPIAVAITIAWSVPMFGLSLLAETGRAPWIASLASTAFGVSVGASLADVTMRKLRRDRASLAGALSSGFYALPIAIATGVPKTFVLDPVLELPGWPSWVAFVVAICLACCLALVVPAYVVEARGVFHAIARSFALTRGSRLKVFACLFLVAVFTAFCVGIFLTHAIVGLGGGVWFWLSALAGTLLVAASFPAVLVTVLYHDLRDVAGDPVDA